MLMISARKDFWDSNILSDSDEIRDVYLDDDSLGDPLAEGDFLNRIKDKKILLIIHGYNNEEDDVVRAYSIIEKKVNSILIDQAGKQLYDCIIGYTWPGGDDGLDYFAARRKAGAISPRVDRWLSKIGKVVETVDIMSHSMGCRISLQAQKYTGEKRVRNLFTMAAAVDDESIEKNEEFFGATQLCDAVYVFHSVNDPVLECAYKMAERDRALGYAGPEDTASIIDNSKNVKVINCKNVIKKHGGYKDCDHVYQYLVNEFGPGKANQFTTLS